MTCAQQADEMRPFNLLISREPGGGPRLGRLLLRHGHAIETPHYLAITSRGVVPHLSQDNLQRHTNIKAAYLGLEDFIENAHRRTPPILDQLVEDGKSPLRSFTSLPKETLLFLAPRRIPPVLPPTSSRKSEQAPDRSIPISTSVGFQTLDLDEYIDDVLELKPDIVIGMSDNILGETPGRRRIEKMADRTNAWTRKLLQSVATKEGSPAPTYALAPILPLDAAVQSQYFAQLEDEMGEKQFGLALYDTGHALHLPEYLQSAMCLSLDGPETPQQVLNEVALGVDLFVLPFIGAATDAGLALDFIFPAFHAPEDHSPLPSKRQCLTIDLWAKDHATDLGPLRQGCPCYTCKTHHRAYLHHLLNAKEMLAWVLLQIHNHQIVDAFFGGIRESISTGSFENDAEVFNKAYGSEFPKKTGQGPRLRGYQMKTEGPGERRKNTPAYNTLNDVQEKTADAPLTPSPGAEASHLEDQGLGTAIEGEALTDKATGR